MTRPADALRAKLRAFMAEGGIVFDVPPGEEGDQFFTLGCGYLMGVREDQLAKLRGVEAKLLPLIATFAESMPVDSLMWKRYAAPLVDVLATIRAVMK